MSVKQIQIISTKDFTNCSSVGLCLKSEWSSKTLSGIPYANGKIVGKNAYKLPGTIAGCVDQRIVAGYCPPCGSVFATNPATPAYTVDAFAYTINIEDTQFGTNTTINLPYVLAPNDVCDITADDCFYQALIAALIGNQGVQINSTLERDANNLLGISSLLEPDSRVPTILGFNLAGDAVRLAQHRVVAVMSSNSASLGSIAPLTPTVVDFNTLLSDDNADAVVGSDWHYVVPKNGDYRISVSVRFTNTFWGRSGSNNYPAVVLYYKYNTDAAVHFALTYLPGVNDSSNLVAPLVQGTDILLNLVKGSTVRILAEHSDTVQPVHAMLHGHQTRILIERLLG